MIETSGTAGGAEDFAWLSLGVEGDLIASARGEGPGVAELCREVRGRTILGAAAVQAGELALDALHEAIGSVIEAPPHPERVAVAMSGGVDSAVALLATCDRGLAPVGVTLRLWVDPAAPDGDRACCSPDSVRAARRTCHAFGLPHVTLDLRTEFRRAVVGEFIAGYSRGETPNPCTRCNGTFRFAELLDFAERVGASQLATGHYARLVEHRGRLLLARAVDRDKDQSYMLATLDPRSFSGLTFPLGNQTKQDTRAQARRAGLPQAGRQESQEACFLGGGDYRDFLLRHGLESRSGPILDLRGRSIGRHDGFWRFTPGQRRGLGISSPGPLYALETDSERNAVVVGPHASLARQRVYSDCGQLFVPARRVAAKLRYRSEALPASIVPSDGGFMLEFDEPAFGVACGQTAVVYEGDAVVGSGTITGVD